MKHQTTIYTWLEDAAGDQREYQLEVTVAVYDIEDGDVQFRSIDHATLVETGESVPIDQLPQFTRDEVKFEISEHKYEIANETREPEPDYHHSVEFERRMEARHS